MALIFDDVTGEILCHAPADKTGMFWLTADAVSPPGHSANAARPTALPPHASTHDVWHARLNHPCWNKNVPLCLSPLINISMGLGSPQLISSLGALPSLFPFQLAIGYCGQLGFWALVNRSYRLPSGPAHDQLIGLQLTINDFVVSI